MLCCTLAGIAGAAAGGITRRPAVVLGPRPTSDLVAELMAAPLCSGNPTRKE